MNRLYTVPALVAATLFTLILSWSLGAEPTDASEDSSAAVFPVAAEAAGQSCQADQALASGILEPGQIVIDDGSVDLYIEPYDLCEELRDPEIDCQYEWHPTIGCCRSENGLCPHLCA